jgi:hypothetical protein
MKIQIMIILSLTKIQRNMTKEECPGKNHAGDKADIWWRAVERHQ